MFLIHVKSLPLKDVLKNLALDLGVQVVRDCELYSIKLPSQIGEGYISAMDLNNGLGFIFYDCLFHEDVQFNFSLDIIHPVKFLFCEEGSLIHRFEQETTDHTLEEYENAIVASSYTNGHILNFKAGIKVRLNSLEINRGNFNTFMDCELNSLTNDLGFLFKDLKASKEFYYHGNYCLSMADLFTILREDSSTSFLKKLIWEGSALQILNLQVLQFQDKNSDLILRKIELKQVIYASEIIKKDILDYKSVSSLARDVGLASSKLQNGFKYLYNTTVNEYVMSRRLDLAKTLLEQSDHNISEIVYLVGLSSRSYFSRVFKKRYDISPSALLKMKKENSK